MDMGGNMNHDVVHLNIFINIIASGTFISEFQKNNSDTL